MISETKGFEILNSGNAAAIRGDCWSHFINSMLVSRVSSDGVVLNLGTHNHVRETHLFC